MVQFFAVATEPASAQQALEECIAASMRAALGYDEVKLTAALGPGTYLVARAPPGTVKTPSDGERLVAELRRAFPGHRFVIEKRTFDPIAFLIECDARRTQHAARVA